VRLDVSELLIERVPTNPQATKLEPILRQGRDGARLIDFVKLLLYIPVEGARSVHVDEQTLRDLFADPTALRSLYGRDP
jgi:hypothetical protein